MVLGSYSLSISVAANVLFYKNITLSFLLFFFVILNKLQAMKHSWWRF